MAGTLVVALLVLLGAAIPARAAGSATPVAPGAGPVQPSTGPSAGPSAAGPAPAAQLIPRPAGHHARAQRSVRPATGAASVAGLTPQPERAFWLGLLAAGVMVAAGCAAMAGQRRTSSSIRLGDAAVVVGLLAATLTLSAAADGNSLLVRGALALPGAVLIAGGTLAVTGQLRQRLPRVLIGGMCASTMTVGVVSLWGSARWQLLAVPGDRAFAALPWQVASVAVVVSLLAGGGWLATSHDHAAELSRNPPFGGRKILQ